ncbi:ketopantoate reductase family protein [Idiomarina xiamenensis]|uniref:2-dehydropantoate 2-reductase n=1 Tax=Idiomarina xiamenensis 10-D-4 TaxID=740709 RepID=K2K5J4_9GAMM|nr:2-dehydropantoate 2-reductase [Idiomarina xiamenensis]EKE82863.1 2-dehydropantoate 2-reductase [Idiomarina xiamenensis 10-D-4]
MTDNATQHWVMVGCGALAQWLGCSLIRRQPTLSLSVLHRQQRLRSCNYRLSTNNSEMTIELPTQHHDDRVADVVIAAVKAYQVSSLLRQLNQAPWFTDKTHLILSFNGMHSEPLTPLVSVNQQFLVTTSGVTRDHQGAHLHGIGQSWLGPMATNNVDVDNVFDTLAEAIAPLQGVDDIEQIRWQKLLINCAINALTVVADCVNGELLKAPYQATLHALLSEACDIAAQHGYHFDVEQSLQQTQQVLSQTAANSSSMRQDVLAARPTEIDYLNGFITKRGRQLGIVTPVNERLWQQVSAISCDHPQ